MRSPPSLARTVLGLGLSGAAWLSACGSQFTSTPAASTAGSPQLAGGPGQAGESAGGNSGSGDQAAGHGGVADTVDGGRDSVDGLAGSGGAGGVGDEPNASDPYRDAVLADEPLVYWRMGSVRQGAIPDETGHGNDLVLQGDGHELGVTGALPSSDSAIGFDGRSSFAIATDSRALDFVGAAPFSLECWARRESGGGSYFQYLLSDVAGVPDNRDGYALYLLPEPATGETPRSAFERDQPGHDLGIWGPAPEPSSWAYYVAVFDGRSVTLYVNGTLAATAPASGNLAARETPFAVARAAGGANFFKGALDEIAVYPRALNAAVVARHLALTK